MNKIYQVLSNLKFGETLHKAGDIFEGEVAHYEYLVADKVLRVVEGAKSVAHAMEIIAAEKAAIPTPEEAAVIAPKDTWGAQPDKQPEAPKAPEADATVIGDGKQPTTPPEEVKNAAPSLDGGLGNSL